MRRLMKSWKASTCGDQACQAGETCINCESDCGICPIIPQDDGETGDGGGSDEGPGSGDSSGNDGGTGGTGDGGVGGGSKASVRGLNFLPAQAGKEASISVLVSNGLPLAQNFVVDLQVFSGTTLEFSDNFTTTVIGSGKTFRVNFPKKWIPAAGGDYTAEYALYSSDRAIKHDSKEMTVKIAGAGANAAGSGAEQGSGEYKLGSKYAQNKTDANAPPATAGAQASNTAQPAGIDYPLIIVAVLVLVLAAVFGRKLIKA